MLLWLLAVEFASGSIISTSTKLSAGIFLSLVRVIVVAPSCSQSEVNSFLERFLAFHLPVLAPENPGIKQICLPEKYLRKWSPF